MQPDAAEDRTDQSSSSTMSTPAVNVQLLPGSDAITTVFSQSADSAVFGDAAVYDC